MRAPPTIHLLVGAYVGGLVAALAFRPSQGAALALVGVVALWALVFVAGRPGWPSPAPQTVGPWHRRLCASALPALLPLVAVAGLIVGAARLDAQAHSRLTRFVGHTVVLQATALTLPKVSGERLTLDVEVTAVDGAAVAERAPLTLDLGTAPPPPFTSLGPLVEGTRLRLPAAQIEALPVAKPGAFDYGRYLERRGEHVVLAAPLDSLRLTGRRGGVGRSYRPPAPRRPRPHPSRPAFAGA